MFNVLLQVLDDGRLTDGQGRTVDFKNAIIIMTSNIGSPIIQVNITKRKKFQVLADHDEMEQLVRSELKSHFRPEFLNRVDDIIIFHSLDESQIARDCGHPAGTLAQTPRPTATHAGSGSFREKFIGERRL